ncbi:MAG: hypothetical protein ABSG69_13155 [Candidatus Acidiferrum sp.]|jgi:hypothetical protein
MQSEGSISIWFFIGVSLLVNGLLVFAAGLYELRHPPETPLVLFHLHAGVWWGAILAVVGAAYSIRYKPAQGRL